MVYTTLAWWRWYEIYLSTRCHWIVRIKRRITHKHFKHNSTKWPPIPILRSYFCQDEILQNQVCIRLVKKSSFTFKYDVPQKKQKQNLNVKSMNSPITLHCISFLQQNLWSNIIWSPHSRISLWKFNSNYNELKLPD